MIVSRGWGILIVVVPILWWLTIVIAMASWGYYEPDAEKAAAMVYRSGAAGCFLGVLTLWPFVRYRTRVAPGRDELAFIPMQYFIPVLALLGVAALVGSFVPAALRAF